MLTRATYVWNDESPSRDACCCASATVVAKADDPATPPAMCQTPRMMVADKAMCRIILSARPSELHNLRQGLHLKGKKTCTPVLLVRSRRMCRAMPTVKGRVIGGKASYKAIVKRTVASSECMNVLCWISTGHLAPSAPRVTNETAPTVLTMLRRASM